jgi:hypothetical protein
MRRFLAIALVAMPMVTLAQFTAPHTTTTDGDVAGTLGATVFVNHGLVGVGRISASQLDGFGESFGSASGMQVTNWARNPDGSYRGTMNILPDRGYNSGAFFADYHARIQSVNFVFNPYYGAANIGGATIAEKIVAQNQIQLGPSISGLRFTYHDDIRNTDSFTTGLDPGAGFTTLFGKIVPYVINFTGLQAPDSAEPTTYTNVNKLPIDAEALVLKNDGSGYIGDEYGGYVYYFDSQKRIVAAIVPPPAMVPHLPLGNPFYGGAPNPLNGRRPNQGIEGVALSPDGTRLFALLQSGTMQDSDSSANQTRRNTRLLVYDVSSQPVPDAPIQEFALTLPTYRGNGNGGGASNLNNTCQQSEVVALDNTRILVFPRDGNGLGATNNNQSVYKAVILVDTAVGAPTEFAGDPAKNNEGGIIATVSGGASNLLPGVTGLSWTEAVNILNTTQLSRFNIALDSGVNPTKLTLGEKWEGLAFVPAFDPAVPNDYFLFVGNDNDFLTSAGKMRGPDGTIINYNGFAAHPAARIPPAVGSPNNENDTVFLAFRVTLAATPAVDRSGFSFDRRTQRFTQQVTIRNTGATTLTGPIYLALDGLTAGVTLSNAGGVTANNAPLGSPFIQVVPAGTSLAPGAAASVTLQFANPSMGAIGYGARVLVLTGQNGV